MNTLTYGIEIEAIVPSRHYRLFPVGSYRRGTPQPLLPSGWVGKSDSSIETYGADGFTIEFVSPVLSGAAGIAEIERTLATLKAHGITTNRSCGLHVHVGAQHLSAAQMEAVKATFAHHEAAFFAASGNQCYERLHGRSWEYCKPAKDWRRGDRHSSLNVMNWAEEIPGKQTIEVRCFAGTTARHRVIGAVCMTTALVARTTALASGAYGTHPFLATPPSDPAIALAAFLDLYFATEYLPVDANAAKMIRLSLLKEGHAARLSMHNQRLDPGAGLYSPHRPSSVGGSRHLFIEDEEERVLSFEDIGRAEESRRNRSTR